MNQKTADAIHVEGSVSKSDAIYEELRDFVLRAQPEQSIAPERRLAQEYGVTVGTIRRAIKRLVADELIYTVHGKGSFVAPRVPATGTQRILLVDDWGDATHPFYMSRLRGLSAQAGTYGYRLEMFACPNGISNDEMERLVEAVHSPEVIGVVVPWLDSPRFRALREANPAVHVVATIKELHIPGTISVLADYAMMGHMAAEWLHENGAHRIVTMGTFHEAHMAAAAHLENLDVAATAEELPPRFAQDAEVAAEWILNRTPDGVAFFDDRLAQNVLAKLAQRAPKFWNTCRAISASNARDDILPPFMARLEIDGARLGQLAVHTIHSLNNGIALAGTRLLVSPHLFGPGTGSL